MVTERSFTYYYLLPRYMRIALMSYTRRTSYAARFFRVTTRRREMPMTGISACQIIRFPWLEKKFRLIVLR